MEYTDKATLSAIIDKATDPLDFSMIREMIRRREELIAREQTIDNLKKALQDYSDAD